MASRFDGLYNPQPWVSSHIPLPLKEIELGYARQQDTYDEGMADAIDAEAAIVGGNRTKDQAAALTIQNNKEIEALVDEAAKTGNYNDLKYKVKKISNKLKSNPIYQGIELDKTLSPLADKEVLNDSFGTHVQKFYDLKNKQYNQLDLNTPFNANDYSSVSPGDIQTDFSKEFVSIKPEITRVLEDPENESYRDENGQLHTYNRSTGEETSGITRERVKQLLAPYVASNPNLFGKQSIAYNKAFHEDQNQGSKYDKNDALEDIVDAYLGTYENTKEIQTISKDQINKLGVNSSSSSGGDLTPDKPLDNIVLTTIDDVEKSPTKSAKVSDVNQNAIWVDGEVVDLKDEKTGVTTKVINKDMTNVKAFVGKNSTPEKVEESVKFVENYEYIKTKKAEVDGLSDNETYKRHSYNNADYANAFMDKYKISKDILVYTSPESGQAVTKNEIDENGVSTYDRLPPELKNLKGVPRDGQLINLDILADKDAVYSVTHNAKSYYKKDGKEVMGQTLKNKDVIEAAKKKTNENIEKAKDNFKLEQKLRGIDINNPETKKKLESYSDSLESKLNSNMEIIGSAILTPDTSSDNLFTDKKGNMFSSVFMNLTEQQLEDMSIDPKKHPEDIKLSKDSWWDDDATVYKVRINIPAGGNVSARVRDMETTKGALTDTGESQIPYKQAQVNNKLKNIQYNNVLNEQKTFNSEFKSNKVDILKSIEYLIDGYKGSETLSKAKAKEILTNEKDNPETLYNLYLFMTDPNKQKMLKEVNKIMEDRKAAEAEVTESPASVGKPKAGTWKK